MLYAWETQTFQSLVIPPLIAENVHVWLTLTLGQGTFLSKKYLVALVIHVTSGSMTDIY